MKKITDKDVERLKAGKKITKGFIHMQLDDKGRLSLWSDINITDNYRSLKIDANKLFDHGILYNFGELEINGLNEGLCIIPQYGSQIVIKKKI